MAIFAGAIGANGGFTRTAVNGAPGVWRVAQTTAEPIGNTILWLRSEFAAGGPAYPDRDPPVSGVTCIYIYCWVEWLENSGVRKFTSNLLGNGGEYLALTDGIGACDIN